MAELRVLYDPFMNKRNVFMKIKIGVCKHIYKQTKLDVAVALTKFSLLQQFNFAASLVQKARSQVPHWNN